MLLQHSFLEKLARLRTQLWPVGNIFPGRSPSEENKIRTSDLKSKDFARTKDQIIC